MALTLYFIEMAPDIPTLKNQDILKSFYDKLITEDKGGLVEVALKENDGLAYVKTIFKIPQSPSGVTYIASLTFPFENCSYVIKIQAGEIGTTGIREAIIGDRLFASGEVRPEGNKIIGWLVNPDIYKGFGMNKSELEKYDLEFPDHHLSLTRKLIARIEKEMVFKPEIKKLPPFKN